LSSQSSKSTLRPGREESRRVTTLPEREFFAIRAAWQGMDDSLHFLLLQIASAGRPNRTNRRASMPPVHVRDRFHCKPLRDCGSSGGSRRIGGMSVALPSSPLSPCRAVTTRPGPPCWRGWEKPAIRSWLTSCKTTTGDGDPEHPFEAGLHAVNSPGSSGRRRGEEAVGPWQQRGAYGPASWSLMLGRPVN
jgi:hypothetical protein